MSNVGRYHAAKEYNRERGVSVSSPSEDTIVLHLDSDARRMALNGRTCGEVTAIARCLSRFPACMTWRALGVEE